MQVFEEAAEEEEEEEESEENSGGAQKYVKTRSGRITKANYIEDDDDSDEMVRPRRKRGPASPALDGVSLIREKVDKVANIQ